MTILPVRVWLQDHYYTFSRFLVSRVLTVTQVSYADSLKISLAVKKVLVDRGTFDVTQEQMEEALFNIMRLHGYGDEHICRYRLMTKFNHQRVPLVVMVIGTGCVGKSTLATQLAERLNLSAVLQTDLVFEVSCHASIQDGVLREVKTVYQRFETDEEFISSFRRECEAVNGGLQGELHKVLEEGKSIIIEGIHLDPTLFHNLKRKAEDAEKENGDPFIWAPFLLCTTAEEHENFLDNHWHPDLLEVLSNLGSSRAEIMTELKKNFARIETYLMDGCKSMGIPVISTSVNGFSETLDSLHSIVLDRMQAVVA
ncbi:hypothetical protein GUITHDRAFT_144613 [Guillardia theta CCMP2712]|uniref:2-phosphoglycerate kinase n=1 Tax=Guillardia theta (strain CCMP2712) TaxID=905079 RepID=L1IPV0_GUITC|nr:hypothetical protein GUITHDRAFT_144613 [Guillardia theta CCMP2712]EKX37919.1 hypothetical protein GUITHDRAFT_144613 [Guillardia theta CCMP2712]|eukprot:XP_005824899.1 hypothetical protein GUITHDRAFT_144613 [Guillardia theta CCMP2712]